MLDPLTTLLLVAAIIFVADLFLAGGSMTMAGMSAISGAVVHPLGAGVLVVLLTALILVVAGQI